jgi:hypothetical protein
VPGDVRAGQHPGRERDGVGLDYWIWPNVTAS